MNRQLFLADTQCQLSLKDMIEKTEDIDDQITYYYNKNYIIGKTTQCEIFNGIWMAYHDLILKKSEIYPLEVNGFIQMNYCISGRCELHYKNNKVFYVGNGDLVVGILKNKQYKHSYPLENYSGISIITTEERLDDFLKTIFPKTKLISKKLIAKLENHSEYIVFHNNSEIKNIMNDMSFSNSEFWKEKAIIKFAELVLLIINSDIELQIDEKYYDKKIVNIVKQIKEDVTSNIEIYTKIEEISRKYHISSKAFSECFKAIYGKTYYSFIKEFRIKKAAELLSLGKFTIGEISIMVGYQNASKFSKAFFKVMGVTPICYRKNNLLTVLD